jgi:hypothetical protein
MPTTHRFARIAALLILPLLIATSLAAQPQSKQVSLIVEPTRVTLAAGQTERFFAHLEGAPAGTVVRWAISDRKRDGNSITQDGVFTAGTLGVYHVVAIATNRESAVLKAVRVNVTVLGNSEF